MNGSLRLDDVLRRGSVVTAWFGAISWEDRCLPSLQALQGRSTSVQITALDIDSAAVPAQEDRWRRQRNRTRIHELAIDVASGARPSILELAPGRFEDARRLFAGLPVIKTGVGVLDISGFTKQFAAAAGVAFAKRPDVYRWLVAYTPGKGYGAKIDERDGWERSETVMQVGGRGDAMPPGDARGLLIPGHTASRPIAALSEICPPRGLVLFARSTERPDLYRKALRRNAVALRLLRNLPDRGWRVQTRDLLATPEVIALVDRESRQARLGGERMVLFPFGPKPFVFFASLALARAIPERMWLAYPRALRYDVRSVIDAQPTVWYDLALPRLASLEGRGAA